MKTTVLGRGDIARIARVVGLDTLMDEMIDALTSAVAGFDPERTVVRARDGFHYSQPDVGLLEWMPVMQAGDTTTIKVVGYHPSNPARHGLPTVLATVSVYETATGHLAGLVDGTFLTALRTGAASGVASRILARPDTSTLGLIGCGAQAVTQAHAMLRTFPIERILIHDTDPNAVDTFPDRASRILPSGVEVLAAPIDRIMAASDVVCTATSMGIGDGPLFDDLPTKPWLHVNAVGSDFPGKIELPRSLLAQSLVCPDHLEQAVVEGECQLVPRWDIGPSLAELVATSDDHVSSQDHRTVFDSTGWALEDRVGVMLLLGHADRLGLGQEIALEDIGDDPLDPYQFDGARRGQLRTPVDAGSFDRPPSVRTAPDALAATPPAERG